LKRVDPLSLPLAGKVVIEASAGTGKTYTITSLYLRLLLERKLSPKAILVVTFTRAATAELRERIRLRLQRALDVVNVMLREPSRPPAPDDALLTALIAKSDASPTALRERLESAIDELDEAPVFTIHGFCQRALGDYAFESSADLDVEVIADASPLLEEIADDFTVRELSEGDEGRAALLQDVHRSLLPLAKAALTNQDMRLLPATTARPQLGLSRFRALQAECRALLDNDGPQLREALSRVPKIASYLDTWLPKVGWALRAPYPPIFEKEAAMLAMTRSGVDKKVAQSKKGTARPEHPFFDRMGELETEERELLARADEARIELRKRFVGSAGQELASRTRQRAKSTFDALLVQVSTALGSEHGGALCDALQGKYSVALLDEFQDTDPLQYAIFDRLFGQAPRALFMIGDPKQAIYAFRGADVLAYMRAREDAGEQVYTLDVNYRSDPGLIAALNAAYAASPLPFGRSDIAYVPVRARPSSCEGLRASQADPRRALDLALFDDNDAEALVERVATDLVDLLRAGTLRTPPTGPARAVRPGDIAVLCRTNSEAADVAQALAKRGVSAQLSASESVLDSPEAIQVERALAALVHPTDPRLLRAFLASPFVGADAQALAALESEDRVFSEHRLRISEASELLHARGPLRALTTLFGAYETQRRMLSTPDGLRKAVNLEHLVELLAKASADLKLGPASLLRALRRSIVTPENRAIFGNEAHLLRPIDLQDAVTLLTVHKSKGLEYPVVLVPFFSDARAPKGEFITFHDPEAAHARTLVVGGADLERGRSKRAEEDHAEHARLLYVALTRAQHRVSLYVMRTPTLASSALFSLLGGGGSEAPATADEAFARIGAHCAALAEQHGSHMGVRTLPEASATRYAAVVGPAVPLACAPITRALPVPTSVASFSSLISRSASATADDALDHDAVPQPARNPAPVAPEAALALADFPRGPAAGQLIHEAIEHSAFDATEEALFAGMAQFEEQGRITSAQRASLARGLHAAFGCPLPHAELRLCDVPSAQRRNELEFLLPVTRMLSVAALADAFTAPLLPDLAREYGSRLRDLSFSEMRGYLRGFVDLVFVHDGRYFIVDYKSNDLGPRPQDYAPERLAEPMLSHHYILQYHLYTLALHRHLRARLRGYDYETCFGGVLYLFVRGMHPAHAPGTGVFSDRPARALVMALDHMVGSVEDGP
jgi:exodeoxyribonuclease V beta subunit